MGKGHHQNATLDFATLLFSSWDDEQNGTLRIRDIQEPLLQLGLSNDTNFVEKLIISFDQNAIRMNEENEQIIRIQDFLKIFKLDKMTEKIVSIVEIEARSKRGVNLDESSVLDEQPSKDIEELSMNDSVIEDLDE